MAEQNLGPRDFFAKEDIWQEGCRVFYGAEVQKTRPPGFPGGR